MPEQRLTIEEITQLANRLDQVGEGLSEKERAILLAVFGLASASLSGAVAQAEGNVSPDSVGPYPLLDASIDVPSTGLPSLSEGFLGAFTEGSPAQIFAPGEQVRDSVSVDGGIVSWTKNYNEEYSRPPEFETPARQLTGTPDELDELQLQERIERLTTELNSYQDRLTGLTG